jgi:hypothetical protein
MKRISEDIDTDMTALRQATEARDAFMAYFEQFNSDHPIYSVPGIETMTLGKDIGFVAVVPATNMGLPYDDLWIGFHWEGSKGRQFVVREGNRKRHFITVQTKADQTLNATDLIWGSQWDSFVHEFIHYLDKKRNKNDERPWHLRRLPYGRAKTQKGLARARNRMTQPKNALTYYNDPLEFNAFYHQWVDSVLDELARVIKNRRRDGTISEPFWTPKDFLLWMYNNNFRQRDDWFAAMTPETKKRFMKRFARLYQVIKSQWPDIDIIRSRVEKLEKNDA